MKLSKLITEKQFIELYQAYNDNVVIQYVDDSNRRYWKESFLSEIAINTYKECGKDFKIAELLKQHNYKPCLEKMDISKIDMRNWCHEGMIYKSVKVHKDTSCKIMQKGMYRNKAEAKEIGAKYQLSPKRKAGYQAKPQLSASPKCLFLTLHQHDTENLNPQVAGAGNFFSYKR